MRAQTIAIGLVQLALLMACERPQTRSESVVDRRDAAANAKSASPVALGAVGGRPASDTQASAGEGEINPWARPTEFEAGARLIVRTGQASIEVDSLDVAMAELRRIAVGYPGTESAGVPLR